MVTIIIPFIDETDFLAQALASAQGQIDVETEIILVCNGPKIPKEINAGSSHHHDYTLIHEPEPGSAHARNKGLEAARGEWVQFLDVDDLLDSDKISHQAMANHADVVVSPHTFLFVDGRKENSKWMPADIWSGLLNSGLGSTSSMLWKRKALMDAGGWNVEYQSHQEYELLFRLASAGKFIVPDDHCETIVRQRKSGSITLRSGSIRAKEGIKLRVSMWEYLVTRHLDTPERNDAFRQYIFRQLRGLFRQDKSEAMAVYKKYFSEKRFTPKEIEVPGYGIFYRLFGFRLTESTITFLASLWRAQ